MDRFFRIHPAIGVARVGNSPTQFFVGPERIGEPPNFDIATKQFRPFKDSQGRIKRQAARFRLFEYELRNGKQVPVREVNLGTTGIVSIQWKVHLANRKAAFFNFDGQDGVDGKWTKGVRNPHITVPAEREQKLVIDPGPKTIAGRSQAAVPFTNTKKDIPITALGELRTDADGHLVVLSGLGEANQVPGATLITNYVNNDRWFDDMADGPVSAEVKYLDGGVTKTATLAGDTGAWVMVGPPDYGPAAGNVIRLFDTLWDLSVRSPQIQIQATDGYFDQGLMARLKQQKADWDPAANSFRNYKPSFMHEVFPILKRALEQRNVHNPEASKSFHGTWAGMEVDLGNLASSKGKRLRKTIFGYMRNPTNNSTDPLLMPKALGDNYSDFEGPRPNFFASLTRVQYAVLKQWAEDKFEQDWNDTEAKAIQQVITAEGMDRASMENSVGGPFFPGIDCSWMIRNTELYGSPFRVKHTGTAFPATAKLPIGAGFFSQQMALPWQADFYQCKKTYFPREDIQYDGEGMYHMWWCAHRPDDVFAKKGDIQMVSWTRQLEAAAKLEEKRPDILALVDDEEGISAADLAMYIQMRANWPQLGFVISDGTSAFETQARGDLPTDNLGAPTTVPAPPRY